MRRLRRIICKVMGHKWGPWAYVAGVMETSCCERCEVRRLRISEAHWPKRKGAAA